jgi:hypothetical protein
MDKEYLEGILEKIAEGSATDDELRIYNVWCNAMQEQGLTIPDIKNISEELLQKMHRHMRPTKPFIHKKWVRITAAAAIAAAVYLGVSPFFKNRSERLAGRVEAIKPPPEPNDLSAGTNSATLTLSNGKKIVLADTLTGNIAEQPGVNISKTADGKLIYSITQDPSPKRAKEVEYNTLSTARAQQYQLVLPDGSKVWLNAATTLTYPASFAHLPLRKVELDGEAYFEVAEDKKKPFFVHTKKQDIQDLGTHFNVSAYFDDSLTKTTLLEGSVKINHSKMLQPGQQGRSALPGQVTVADVDMHAAVAWKNGYFEFDDENIYDIMKKVARWYDVEVVYEGDIPVNRMAGSMSRFENASKVLAVLQKTGLLTCRLQGRKIYVSKLN